MKMKIEKPADLALLALLALLAHPIPSANCQELSGKLPGAFWQIARSFLAPYVEIS